jgi:predicted GNAT family acetyltransferase
MESVTHKHRRIPVGMRPGQRQLASASILVSMTDAVPMAMRAKVREVSHVFVPAADRRQRLATALMNLVCQEADANGITLILTVDPYDTGGPTAAGAAETGTRCSASVTCRIRPTARSWRVRSRIRIATAWRVSFTRRCTDGRQGQTGQRH